MLMPTIFGESLFDSFMDDSSLKDLKTAVNRRAFAFHSACAVLFFNYILRE